jgi:hypothetical protein
MKTASLSERNWVIALFILVFITFALAHEDSKKLEQLYNGEISHAASAFANLKDRVQVESHLLTETNTPLR